MRWSRLVMRVLAVILTVAVTACSSVNHLKGLSAERVGDKFDVGDHIELIDQNDIYYQGHILKIGKETISVFLADDRKELAFLYSEIKLISKREISSSKTVGAIIVGFLLSLALAALIVSSITEDQFE